MTGVMGVGLCCPLTAGSIGLISFLCLSLNLLLLLMLSLIPSSLSIYQLDSPSDYRSDSTFEEGIQGYSQPMLLCKALVALESRLFPIDQTVHWTINQTACLQDTLD